MLKTTQCYLIRDHKWLMLLRNKKDHDLNADKWIGVGGKFEEGESPRECIQRELKEETGLAVTNLEFRGILYFSYATKESEKIWTYTCHDFDGEPSECDEGTLAWIEETEVLNLDLWEGDKVFLKKLLENDSSLFCIELIYDDDGNLQSVKERKTEHE